MKTLFALVGLFFVSTFAQAADLTGTYVGCGVSSAHGQRMAIFHLVKIPTGLSPNDFQIAGTFRWSDTESGGLYFPEVKFNDNQTMMFMRLEIKPMREHGTIINTLTIDVQEDGSLVGAYVTNSLTSEGKLLNGNFQVQKIDGNEIPRMTCRE